jgi:hypothetical protein
VLRLASESYISSSGASDLHFDLSGTIGPGDLPPVAVPSFKLGLWSSQARDPGGA